MTKKTWVFDLDGRSHQVELEYGYLSGKRVIHVDGVPVVNASKFFDFGSDHEIDVGGHRGVVRIRPNWRNLGRSMTSDCIIDGRSVVTGGVMLSELAQAKQSIKGAVIAGLLYGGLTLALILLNTLAATNVLDFDLWSLIDVAIIWGLTFGIYKTSRVCAVLLLAYFVFNVVGQVLETGRVQGLTFVTWLFAYYYFQGIRGAFTYHRLSKAEKRVSVA